MLILQAEQVRVDYSDCVIVALKILSNQYSRKIKKPFSSLIGVDIQADLRTAHKTSRYLNMVDTCMDI